jgi:hypothetical protein
MMWQGFRQRHSFPPDGFSDENKYLKGASSKVALIYSWQATAALERRLKRDLITREISDAPEIRPCKTSSADNRK